MGIDHPEFLAGFPVPDPHPVAMSCPVGSPGHRAGDGRGLGEPVAAGGDPLEAALLEEDHVLADEVVAFSPWIHLGAFEPEMVIILSEFLQEPGI